MLSWNRIWRVLVPVVLIAVVLATTMGMVCHDHHRCSADQCTLCHLVIAPTVANTGVGELASAPAEYVVQSDFFISRFVADQISSRAPPA